VLFTVGSTNAFEPVVDRLKVRHNVVVSGRLEHVAVEITDFTSLPPSTDSLFASLATSKHFHMDHIVFLRPEFGVVVGSTEED